MEQYVCLERLPDQVCKVLIHMILLTWHCPKYESPLLAQLKGTTWHSRVHAFSENLMNKLAHVTDGL